MIKLNTGPEKQMTEIIDSLILKNIFVSQLDSSNIAYHHHFLNIAHKPMVDILKKFTSNPRLRSNKWISTSILEDEPKEEFLKYASPEYFVNNLISPVFFYDKLKNLPSDAIVVEVGPHGIFRKIVSETLEYSSYYSLIMKDSNETNMDNFVNVLVKLYELGLNPSVDKLYSGVVYPVCRGTPSIGSLMKWKHNQEFNGRPFPDYRFRTTASDMNVTINLNSTDDQFYSGHCIDGKILFPATGYLMLAWDIFAATMAKTWEQVPVVFEQVQFIKPVFLHQYDKTILKIILARRTGEREFSTLI